MTDTPSVRPANPNFSSGPTTKRPGWSFEALAKAELGRSHRSKAGKAKLKHAIDLTREVLRVPASHRIAIVPGSDTGAVEMAMWSMLGARGVEVLAWESFGAIWVTDAVKQLRLPNTKAVVAEFGKLPDLAAVDFDNDVVFTFNGTTAGVRVPNHDWIPADRAGLTICDATSAAFAMELDYDKLDVVTFSWQKVMGGEAAHGMLILGPRAVERLESFTPAFPLPKLFRMTKNGKLDEALFEGDTINTPSMLCVEDYIDTLEWAKTVGGLDGLMARADASAKAVYDYASRTPWLKVLPEDPATRSNTGVCLTFADPALASASREVQAAFAKDFVALLETKGVAYDFGSYRDAPPGLRIWCGATVETSDVEALLPWLDWAYAQLSPALARAA
ncbi:phosphoserine aminotransferase [Methylopila jiangsuensis]|uniref:phosphoserine transaminase n=1 Tax=Methylopila jiangsuensis TaxID=586230 RepID=A0A9W6N2R9_9HYPH|nr:phosphoserine transaminase [Methylopila jiangsuensis]MDR6284229.1 phosphoserine aminotransferase [Methylopila jiangsuensis]GLK76254.1 phosphoserine aminotransferase [Methylopila jiangsuensis]